MATFIAVGQAVLMVLGGLVILVKMLAPLTETKVDDKLAGALSKAQEFLKKLIA